MEQSYNADLHEIDELPIRASHLLRVGDLEPPSDLQHTLKELLVLRDLLVLNDLTTPNLVSARAFNFQVNIYLPLVGLPATMSPRRS